MKYIHSIISFNCTLDSDLIVDIYLQIIDLLRFIENSMVWVICMHLIIYGYINITSYNLAYTMECQSQFVVMNYRYHKFQTMNTNLNVLLESGEMADMSSFRVDDTTVYEETNADSNLEHDDFDEPDQSKGFKEPVENEVHKEFNEPGQTNNENVGSEDFNEPDSLNDENVEGDVNDVSQLLVADIEQRLEVGSSLESIDQAYLLYCEYARCRGFSVRKGDQCYFHKTAEIRMKEYKCSCEGLTDEKRSQGMLAAYKKQMTRTNCKAKLRVVRTKEGPWKVSSFYKDHNHELVPFEQSYLLRSARNLSHAKKSVLEALNAAGIGVSKACRFMEKEAGGTQNVGFTRKDAYAHMRTLRKETKVDNGDANALVQFFVEKSISEPSFFWNVQMDDNGRLMNFFFRDYRCAIDYQHFGDVLSVDTTYRTNKYSLICAPFVGVNHHMKNIMFGMAFLSDETADTFEWLFTTFLKSMQWKQPTIVFSDQCKAIMKAIDSTFVGAKHRLCQWHINQNAPSHFGVLNNNIAFKNMWYYCMNQCETESEFELVWHNMIETYGLANVRWFTSMYNLKERWSTVFTNDRYNAGLHATSRSEVTNKVLKDLCSCSSSLYQFVLHFERIQQDWRTREAADDTLDLGIPGQFVKNNPLLIQAASTYTRRVYKKFENEVSLAMNVIIMHRPIDYNVEELEFRVATRSICLRARRVTFKQHVRDVACSCRKWETDGILCRHIVRIFLDMNVIELPAQHILRRLCKSAKLRLLDQHCVSGDGANGGIFDDMVFKNHIMRHTYDIVQSSEGRSKCRELILNRINELRKEVNNLVEMEKTGQEMPIPVREMGSNGYRILDPNIAKCRGKKKPGKRNHARSSTARARKRSRGNSSSNMNINTSRNLFMLYLYQIILNF